MTDLMLAAVMLTTAWLAHLAEQAPRRCRNADCAECARARGRLAQ